MRRAPCPVAMCPVCRTASPSRSHSPTGTRSPPGPRPSPAPLSSWRAEPRPSPVSAGASPGPAGRGSPRRDAWDRSQLPAGTGRRRSRTPPRVECPRSGRRAGPRARGYWQSPGTGSRSPGAPSRQDGRGGPWRHGSPIAGDRRGPGCWPYPRPRPPARRMASPTLRPRGFVGAAAMHDDWGEGAP